MFVFIDTAVMGCNVAFGDENGTIACHQEPIDRGHAEHIIPIFETLLTYHNKTAKDINRIIVTVGPGSFTGLRVGITTARTMGFALDKPVHGITSFQSFSCSIDHKQDRIVIVETKRGDYYTQILNADHKALNKAKSLSFDHLRDLIKSNTDAIVTGDAVNRLSEDYNDMKNTLIHQDMINVKSVTQAIAKGCLDFQNAEALYIRDADVSEPKEVVKPQ